MPINKIKINSPVKLTNTDVKENKSKKRFSIKNISNNFESFIMRSKNKKMIDSSENIGKYISTYTKKRTLTKINNFYAINSEGKIISAKTKYISSELNKKINKTTRTSPNNLNPRNHDLPLTSRAAVVKICAELKSPNTDVYEELQACFLMNNTKQDDITSILEKHNYKDKFQHIINRIKPQDEIPKTLQKDAFFSRNFETELAYLLATERHSAYEPVINKLVKFFSKEYLNPELEIDFDNYARGIKIYDKSPWKYTVPEYSKFLENPNRDNFLALFNVNSEHRDMMILTAVFGLFINVEHKDSMKTQTIDSYRQEIKPYQNRNKKNNTPNEDRSDNIGITSRYQRDFNLNRTVDAKGIRTVDTISEFDTKFDTSFHNNSLMTDIPFIVGRSGSSNVFKFIFNKIGLENEELEIAKLLASTLLVYSGGHSYNECYSVFEDTLAPISYKHLYEKNQIFKTAITKAFEKCIEIENSLQ